jgi:hypothetical protein
MTEQLNKDSFMECPRHGIRKPTFICQHLPYASGAGFHEPNESPDPDVPFKNAWCDDCDRVLAEQGEWNDVSEGHARPIAICEGCFEDLRLRNAKNRAGSIT